MLTRIAGFEFRYLLRNPLLWLTALLTTTLLFVGMSVEGFELGSEGGLLENSAYAIARNYLMVSMVFVFVSTSFVANAVIRDEQSGFAPIMHSLRVTRFEYVIGRYLGAFAISAACLLAVPLGVMLGTSMPWADATQLGPNRLGDHLFGYLLLALPNLYIHSAILFALATITRSMMATYLGVIGLVSGFLMLQGSFADYPRLQAVASLIEPFGSRALKQATQYWTVAERNSTLPAIDGVLLNNRLLWMGIATLSLAIAWAVSHRAQRAVPVRRAKKLALMQGTSVHSAPAQALTSTETVPLPAAGRDSTASRGQLFMRIRFEAWQVVSSWAFPLLLVWGLFNTLFVLITQRDTSGRPTYPTTLTMIPDIEDAFFVIPIIVVIYYVGELVWRERDRRMHEIIDAAPMPNWMFVVSKASAMAVVLLSLLLINVLASVLVQLSLDYTHLEIGKYLLWYVLPNAWDMMIIAALAVFVQSLVPHKAVGWGIMTLFILWTQIGSSIQHNLLKFGGLPWMPLSDMNGAGTFWQGAWTLRLYWGAIAVLLLVASHLMWRRGADVRLKPRLARIPQRFSGAAVWVTAAALMTFTATGAYGYYNINVLNAYRSAGDAEQWAMTFETKYRQYHSLPQPVIASLTLDVALHPEQRRAEMSGTYVLRNLTSQPVGEVHVRLVDEDLTLTLAEVEGATLAVDDPEFKYRIYRLDTPMQPGEERVMRFETVRSQRGFRNAAQDTRLVANGTFLDTYQIAPFVGISMDGMINDPDQRSKLGLPEGIPRPTLEDTAATKHPSFGGGWALTDITVSTVADQTPLAPGRKVSDSTIDGRRIARFVSEAPVRPAFSIQSARYDVKYRTHSGVELAVYHHAAHPWNVDRMLDALAVSLDYFQKHFGPYQFTHARIIEFPGYAGFAQAFAGTIPYSETYGFIAKVSSEETVDIITGTTAHELAHQYWAHQVAGADMQGSMVLSETLAQYSAMMVMKQVHGEDQIRRHLKFELDKYLAWRASAPANEPALARADGQTWVIYQKGALAMYLLQKRLGEEAVNRALRNLLEQYKFKGAPYPRSLDLVERLRAEATTEEHQTLITDLFERVVLYDMKVIEPSAVQRADGKWDVTVPIDARKLHVDSLGSETEVPLREHIEIGLFTAEPGIAAFDASNVMLFEPRSITGGKQVLKFVTDRKPTHAGIDPYNFYIDRNSTDNVRMVK